MNRKEIMYNLINSGIAGALVFAGALASGDITTTGIGAAVGAALIVFLTKFREYWHKTAPPTTTLFCFI